MVQVLYRYPYRSMAARSDRRKKRASASPAPRPPALPPTLARILGQEVADRSSILRREVSYDGVAGSVLPEVANPSIGIVVAESMIVDLDLSNQVFWMMRMPG